MFSHGLGGSAVCSCLRRRLTGRPEITRSAVAVRLFLLRDSNAAAGLIAKREDIRTLAIEKQRARNQVTHKASRSVPRLECFRSLPIPDAISRRKPKSLTRRHRSLRRPFLQKSRHLIYGSGLGACCTRSYWTFDSPCWRVTQNSP